MPPTRQDTRSPGDTTIRVRSGGILAEALVWDSAIGESAESLLWLISQG
jgi:hypothetical protein